jgi:hypothetical protein
MTLGKVKAAVDHCQQTAVGAAVILQMPLSGSQPSGMATQVHSTSQQRVSEQCSAAACLLLFVSRMQTIQR